MTEAIEDDAPAEDDAGEEHGGGDRGDQRPMMPDPAAGPDRPWLPVGRDRLIGEPAFHVVGKVADHGIPVLRSERHRLQTNRFECPWDIAPKRARPWELAPL